MNAEKLTVPAKVALALATACVLGTLEVCRRTWMFVEAERDARAMTDKETRQSFGSEVSSVRQELSEVRSEVAEVGDAVESQAVSLEAVRSQSKEQIEALSKMTQVQLEALTKHVTTQLDFLSRETNRIQEENRRQADATAGAFRDLRDDLRAGASKPNGKPRDE